MKQPQPVHKCDSLCGVEIGTTAPGGASLGNVMKEKGDTGPAQGAKALPNQLPSPAKGGGGSTEQPQ